MNTEAAILLVAALVVGVALGWVVWGRQVAAWEKRHEERDSEARTLSEQIKEMTRDLAVMSEREAQQSKAADERLREREEQFEREMTRLATAEEALKAKFNEIGEKLLSGAGSKFLENAQVQLSNLNKESLSELEKKVAPVGETLERYRKRVDEIEKSNAAGFHQLQGVIQEVQTGQLRVIEGAKQITTTLRGAPKAGGDWGELQLENLLESCGLHGHCDFDLQSSVKGEDGSLRPDVVINIPGGHRLVVDVKNVFNTYSRANEASNDEEKSVLLKAHAREIRGHIDDLSSKRYQDFVDGSADFVVMFIPGEHVLYAALMQDPGLLDYALKRRIVLSSPLNFMSIALTVSTIWRQAGMQADAEEIGRLGKELYDRIGRVAEFISKMRRGLTIANGAFDDLVGSFDKNLRRTAERFEELSVDTSAKDVDEVLPLNVLPRKLTNFPDQDAAE